MPSTLLEREQLVAGVAERSRLRVDEDESGWSLVVSEARDGARLRRTFRNYLEHYGHPASDFNAAEAVYGELVSNCVKHAPGEIRIEFRWSDSTLAVTDAVERLRSWPFSPDDTSAESTHHAYALISAFTDRIHVTRDPERGTRASVVLPVMPAKE
ncbi:MAG: hypothetical protein QOJ39_1072 [Candidatus Eremiobacteraeota bacterium]|nr:hypothetical protein [Candidatus Eremiobacteraeota bacterium]